MVRNYTGRKRVLTDAEIVELYRQLRDSETVAIRAGCSHTAVLKLARAAGVEIIPPGARKFGPRTHLSVPDEEICRRYRAGESGPSIARSIGATNNQVYAVLQRNGVNRREMSSAQLAALRRKQREEKSRG